MDFDGLADDLRAVVAQARTADQAVARIAVALPAELKVSRVGLRLRPEGAEEVVVVGVWSAAPTVMGAGRRIPATGPVGELYGKVVRTGRADIHHVGEGLAPVVERLMLEEGNVCGVQIPLKRDGRVRAILALLSASSGAFEPGSLDAYEAIGDALAPTLVPLADDAVRGMTPGGP